MTAAASEPRAPKRRNRASARSSISPVHIHQFNDGPIRGFQDRLGQRTRPGTQIKHPFGLDPDDDLRGTPKHGFVARNKRTNRRIVGLDVELQVLANGVIHRWRKSLDQARHAKPAQWTLILTKVATLSELGNDPSGRRNASVSAG